MTRSINRFARIISGFFFKADAAVERALNDLCCEPLESRVFLSGSVLASVVDGNLSISGDGSANAIVLDQAGLKADQIRITAAGHTRINKQTTPLILSGLTRGLGIRLGGGDDHVTLQNLVLPGGLWIVTDAGADTLAINNLKIANTLSIGSSSIVPITMAISNTTVGGQFKISTGDGGESLAIKGVEVMGTTKIGSGDGADNLTIDDSTFHQTVHLYTGAGADKIEIEANGDPNGSPTLFNARLLIEMKDGDDTLVIGVAGETGNSTVFSDGAKLYGGDGTNTLENTQDATHFRIRDFETKTPATDTDTVAPTVSSSSPADQTTGVTLNRKIAATFSEAMDASTITTDTVTLTSGSTAIAGTVAYVGTTATFTPTNALTSSTDYTFTVTTGAKDVAGNALASNFISTFTTGTASDTTAPVVSSTDPADEATGVATNKKITATFSEAMDPATITSAEVSVTGPGSVAVLGTVAYVGTIMTFTPTAALAPNATYTATISTGAHDLAGNALAADAVWSFTTGATADVIAPTVTSTDPANLKTKVFINHTVAATFSESMDPLTIPGHFIVTAPGNVNVAGTLNYDQPSKTVTFTPSSNLAASTTFTATITGGANGVKDLAGNALASNKVWTFTTGTQIAQSAIQLGSASSFAIMATASITNTGLSVIKGDVGLHAGTSQGIPTSDVVGTIHVNDQAIINAQTALLAAYNDAVSRSVTPLPLPADIGGLTFTPGLYTNATAVQLQGSGSNNNLTLDAQGDPNAVFIFQMGTTLKTGPAAQVILAGGAKASNIFWQVGSSATLDTTTIFKGNILAAVTITAKTGANIEGRLLAGSSTDGSVTLDTTTVTVPAA